MLPIAKWTVRQRRWSVFWWCFGIAFYIFLTLVFYPSIKHQTAQLDKSFDQLSTTAKQLITDTGDLFSPVGYLSSQLFYLMLPLLYGILAINLGVSLIGKEERESTIEMLLARPVSRGKLLFGKALAGLGILTFVSLIGTLFVVIMCQAVGLNVGLGHILEAGLAVWLLSISFGAIAYLASAFGRAGRAAAIGLSAFIALGGYILVSLAGTLSWLKWPAKIFPFNYYHASELLTGNYHWLNAIYFIAVAAGCLLLAWLAFRRRDLMNS